MLLLRYLWYVDLLVDGALSVDIQCTAERSCRFMNAFIANTSTVGISCGPSYACSFSEFVINASSVVNTVCTGQGSCYISQFTIIADKAVFIADGGRALSQSTVNGQAMGSGFCFCPHSFFKHMLNNVFLHTD